MTRRKFSGEIAIISIDSLVDRTNLLLRVEKEKKNTRNNSYLSFCDKSSLNNYTNDRYIHTYISNLFLENNNMQLYLHLALIDI